MPLKKAKTTEPTTKCDFCDASIVDGKEDALLCEGPCSKWFHHYSVGVPLSHFKDLVNSSKPFTCPACFHVVNQAVVCQLQADVASLIKDMVEVLSEIKINHCHFPATLGLTMLQQKNRVVTRRLLNFVTPQSHLDMVMRVLSR